MCHRLQKFYSLKSNLKYCFITSLNPNRIACKEYTVTTEGEELEKNITRTIVCESIMFATRFSIDKNDLFEAREISNAPITQI